MEKNAKKEILYGHDKVDIEKNETFLWEKNLLSCRWNDRNPNDRKGMMWTVRENKSEKESERDLYKLLYEVIEKCYNF